jgi:hypothetical protein
VIGAQMGWQLAGVLELLETYGHGDVGALEAIDKAFKSTTPLRAVNSDASQTQMGAPDRLWAAFLNQYGPYPDRSA